MPKYLVTGRVFGAKGELLTGKVVEKKGEVNSDLFEKATATRKAKAEKSLEVATPKDDE